MCSLFFERFVLFFCLKIERFVPDSAEIWICGLYPKEDPTEMHNLYGNSDYASIVDSLKETMLELQEQYNDPVRFSPERDRD